MLLAECSKLYSVYNESKSLLDLAAHRKESNFVQVTIGSRVIVFDLASSPDKPIAAVKDLPAISRFVHPDIYVETEVRL